MPVSVREVAERAGVSVGTVSNVLNGRDHVRPATVARVRAAIDELGFVPNAAARQLRAGRSTTIALVVLDIGNPFFTDVARGAERRAAEDGMSLVLANSDESADQEAAHLDLFERQRVAGLLIVPVGEMGPRLAELHRHGVPAVLVDRQAPSSDVCSVAVDDVEGGRLAAGHLLETGRRSLAFVGGPASIRQVQDRLAGARTVADAAGAVFEVVSTPTPTLDAGREAGQALLGRVHRGEIDGIVAANDLLAIGIEQALLSGPDPVAIPDQVGLVGYDDIDFAAASVVPITSIRQPREEMGATAVDLLLRADAKADQVVFRPELVVRASTVRAP